MNRILITLFVLGIIAIGSGVAWYLVQTRNDARLPVADVPPQAEDMAAQYTNDTYGFRIEYPVGTPVTYAFTPENPLGIVWRMGALPDAAGIPIVAFTPYHTESDNSYPRSYTALVRIGASTDTREVARCLEAAPGEMQKEAVMLGGKEWQVFSYGDAAMQRFVRGDSFRILHEGACLAVEQIAVGSHYRDDIPSERDIPDAVLDAEYAKLSSIISSFTFVP